MIMIRNTFLAGDKFPLVTCLLLALAWAPLALTQSAQHPFLQQHEEMPSDLQPDEPFVVSKTFAFDVNFRNFFDHLTIHENISSPVFPGGVTGGVKFARGDTNQAHSFIVLVQVSSPSEEALDFVSISSDTYSVCVSSTSSPKPVGENSINIDIIIFSRPRVLQFGHTNIYTTNLDIDIWPDLWFETYHMNLSSVQGTITGTESFAFVAHEISISTINGSIVGNWSLPSTISFSTGNGDIDIDLIPKRWSTGPSALGNLSAVAKAGDIDIRMPFEKDKLSLRNATVRIEAHKGSITGTFVHGVVTSLSAYNSINATLLPYWAFYSFQGVQHNFITTHSSHGNTIVNVLSPIIDNYYKINPLFFAISRHTQGWWGAPLGSDLRMEVTYPGEWGGTAVGFSGDTGLVVVSGEDFEEVERNETMVKVQRWPLGSDLRFEAGDGIAELRLNPCSTPDCAFPRS
jgi:hypothetical protein